MALKQLVWHDFLNIFPESVIMAVGAGIGFFHLKNNGTQFSRQADQMLSSLTEKARASPAISLSTTIPHRSSL
jgi:hypothetical protein